MMNRISALMLLIAALQVSQANSQPLTPDAPERKQLIAMGFDFQKEDPGDSFSIVSNGTNKIAISRNAERLAVGRYFIRQKKNLSAPEEHELLKIINTLNQEYNVNFSISDGFIAAVVYDFGAYDPRIFARTIRKMDNIDVIFDLQPRIKKLVNN